MAFTLSAQMNLIIPTVGTEPGPTYAEDINNSLNIIDGHDHTPGSGVYITPDAININKNLPLNGFSLTTVAALSLLPQSTDAIIDSLYVKGVDLYYRDGSGNVIRVTQSGSVSGATGTITGLPSGTASASFGAGVFTFQAATLTPANIDGGSFVFRNNAASSFGMRVSPPTAMAADTAITLPVVPSINSFLTIDTGGNIVASSSTTVLSSASSGLQTVPPGPDTAITNQSVSPQSTGRPLKIEFVSGNANTPSYIQVFGSGTTCNAYIRRNGTIIAQYLLVGATLVSPTVFNFIDVLAPIGTNTYFLSIIGGGGAIDVSSIKMVAYEI